MLITNDGKLTHRVLSQQVPKTYEVLVKGMVDMNDVERLRRGVVITIELGLRQTKYRTKPAEAKVLQRQDNATLLEITITEGKKRQIRKMCEAIGHKVISLTRTKIGKLTIRGLEPGEYRFVKKEEVM